MRRTPSLILLQPESIGTTVAYNPFGDYRQPIATNSLPVAFATVHPTEIDVSKLGTLDVNIYTTSLFKLPAGGLVLAFGGQFRRETLTQQPDELQVSGDIFGGGTVFFTNAGRKTYAFYAEGYLPVFSPTFSAAGFHALEFTAAIRFEEFLSNDANVLVPKFGMRWQPFDESLTIRATWGEGFHVPSLIELFGNPTELIRPNPLFDPIKPRNHLLKTFESFPGATQTFNRKIHALSAAGSFTHQSLCRVLP